MEEKQIIGFIAPSQSYGKDFFEGQCGWYDGYVAVHKSVFKDCEHLQDGLDYLHIYVDIVNSFVVDTGGRGFDIPDVYRNVCGDVRDITSDHVIFSWEYRLNHYSFEDTALELVVDDVEKACDAFQKLKGVTEYFRAKGAQN